MVQNFDAKLKEYARLLVKTGVNLQPGQTPILSGSVECAPLLRLCVEAAYDAGARDVIVDWSDDFVTRQRYLKADHAVFSEFPDYQKEKFNYLTAHSCPRLSIAGSDPEMLKGINADRIQRWQRTCGEYTQSYYDAMCADVFQWSIGACATRSWAKKVFPEKSAEDAMDALWDAIFFTCRVTGDGKAAERWQTHIEKTAQRSKSLNDYHFRSLRYQNSLGTDLTLTLPENHLWAGGAEISQSGVPFVANMPTEEIFTAPRYDGVNGRVYAALPLSLDGNLVRDFYLDFQDGKITGLHAEEGEDYLLASTQLDEGSSYLGEVSLVPYDSPIRNSGILFYSTLFDENASCHLAFGSAYPTSVRGGEKCTPEEQKQCGLNQSINHVDFMVGTKDLSVVGMTQDGREIPVFVDGNFAF